MLDGQKVALTVVSRFSWYFLFSDHDSLGLSLFPEKRELSQLNSSANVLVVGARDSCILDGDTPATVFLSSNSFPSCS